MSRRTVLVDGPLAYRMRRTHAARAGDVGVQILTLSALAARLAGGFRRPVEPSELDGAIHAALDEGGLGELQKIHDLPGMTRAVAATLRRLWNADLSALNYRARSPRWAAIATLEERVRGKLSGGVLLPLDLRDAALARSAHAAALLGPIEIFQVPDVAPIWRPLLLALVERVPCSWVGPAGEIEEWWRFDIQQPASSSGTVPRVETTPSPRAEVEEALRWARELVASGRAKPEEIGVCAASPSEYDSHFLVYAAGASLALHFSHGRPAMATWEGQACAALADVLLRGISQLRLRRLLSYSHGKTDSLSDLPFNWWLGLEQAASLSTMGHWEQALKKAYAQREDGVDVSKILLPVIESLSGGVSRAAAIEGLLPRAARLLWRQALQQAPSDALEYSLQSLRVPDSSDPSASVAWGPAKHLEAAPRPWMRMLGLTSRSWPRSPPDDPLLPAPELAGIKNLPTVRDMDRRAFATLKAHATRELVISRSRYSVQGSLQGPSPLLSKDWKVDDLRRAQIPKHAFSEVDRILARDVELSQLPVARSASSCWADWQSSDVTVHDGAVVVNDPVLKSALAVTQSATSLHRMLRDPIGYMWRYALGWHTPTEDAQLLALDPGNFGELVHALLRDVIATLEPSPGVSKATHAEVNAALKVACDRISTSWPLVRTVPPAILWRHTLSEAAGFAAKALTLGGDLMVGTRTWSEVDFGDARAAGQSASSPWSPAQTVTIPGTNITIKGTIDRVDLREAGDAVRVTDYKTGAIPKNPQNVRFGYGGELQRVIYSIAARALVPGSPKIVARLVFLASDPPAIYGLNAGAVEEAMSEGAIVLRDAAAALARGHTLLGPDSRSEWNSLQIALPSSIDSYAMRKMPAVRRTLGSAFTGIWEQE